MIQPHGTLPHDDHFHVRIACPSNMSGCVENPVVHIARRPHGRAVGRQLRESARRETHGAEPRQAEPARTDAVIEMDHQSAGTDHVEVVPAANMVEATEAVEVGD